MQVDILAPGVAVIREKLFLFDVEDTALLLDNTWWWISGGYLFNHTCGLFHRVILLAAKGEEVDHKNRKPYDCRKENLRLTTRSHNTQNSKGRSKNGFRGVHYSKSNKGYMVEICKDYKKVYLGTYKNPFAAAVVYDKAAIYLFGKDAFINYESMRADFIEEIKPLWK